MWVFEACIFKHVLGAVGYTSKLASEVLRLAKAKTPVDVSIGRNRNKQVLLVQAAIGFKRFGE